jgi:DNA-binding transcriptional ArsR family regulator
VHSLPGRIAERVRFCSANAKGLAELSEAPRSVGELAAAVEMEQSAVSHQLRLLRHLGLVVGERQGKRIVYALHDSHVAVLLAEATYHVEHLRLGLTDRAAKAS